MNVRILTLHAFYQVLGGEDVSHRTEVAHLRERGHDVEDLTVDNASLARLSTPARLRATVSNAAAGARVAEAIARFEPEVAYVNNLFPGWSGEAIAACTRAGVPVVRVLRNYRFACVSGNLFREGRFCDACVGHSGLPGIVHGCYRDSRATSAVATLARRADRAASDGIEWIAISEFVRAQAIRAGLPGERVSVRPNLTLPTADLPEPSPATASSPAATVLYVGRDSAEKGLPVAIDALRILRDGGSEATLEVAGAARDDAPDGVTFLGQVPHGEVSGLMARAAVLVVPSVWPEPFGRVVIEALAAGTPVVAAASGGLAELAGDGVDLVETGSAAALARGLERALAADRAAARVTARERYARDFAPEVWYSRTMEAVSRARHRKDGA